MKSCFSVFCNEHVHFYTHFARSSLGWRGAVCVPVDDVYLIFSLVSQANEARREASVLREVASKLRDECQVGNLVCVCVLMGDQ